MTATGMHGLKRSQALRWTRRGACGLSLSSFPSTLWQSECTPLRGELRARSFAAHRSTIARELVYCIAHAIHHYALIAIMARLMDAGCRGILGSPIHGRLSSAPGRSIASRVAMPIANTIGLPLGFQEWMPLAQAVNARLAYFVQEDVPTGARRC